MSYDMIDRFLRNNLGDDDYAEYSAALDELGTPQRTWVGLSEEEIEKLKHLVDWTASWSYGRFAYGLEAKLKEKNT